LSVIVLVQFLVRLPENRKEHFSPERMKFFPVAKITSHKTQEISYLQNLTSAKI